MLSNRYFPYLDGFRAIASLLVLLVHTDCVYFQSGWVGVPMFFVLSSFLITNILITNKKSENYFKTFYYRRILRIFPIYYLALFFCLAWGFLMKFDVSQFLYYFLYVQCFTLSNQLEPVFCNSILRHTWSLSVEEIFYLLWPAVIYFLNQKKVIITCVILGVGSLIFKFLLIESNNGPLALLSFFGNLDCLMIGALLSIYITQPDFEFKPWHKQMLIITLIFTVVFILIPFFNISQGQLLFSKIALSFTISWLSFFALLYFVAGNAGNMVKLLLNNQLISYLGKISYGTYLYHLLVYMFMSSLLFHYKISLNSTLDSLLKISLTYGVAIASWHFIEKPILGLKVKMKY